MTIDITTVANDVAAHGACHYTRVWTEKRMLLSTNEGLAEA